MTNLQTNTPEGFAKRAFTRPRPVNTFPPELVEQARKLLIGRRLVDARERSRFTQANIADHLGISTRAYQKVEQKGTTSYERCEQVAGFVEVQRVTAEWLYEGTGPGPGGPLDELDVPVSGDQLAELHSEVAELHGELSEVRSDLAHVLSLLRRGGHGREGSDDS